MNLAKLRLAWEDLQASLWFIPALIVGLAVILAAGLVQLDSTVSGDRLTAFAPKVFGAGAAGSRALLSAIASSMITVAGVTFSITVVALVLASSQYSPRILRNFMQDRANQVVLGVFLGVFAYCIVVLRTIRAGDEGAFVPSLAVFGGVLLAFVAIGFLIFFIHHIAVAIQATSIIGSAAFETVASVERLFPAEIGVEATGEERAARHASTLKWIAIPSLGSGYIQRVDAELLMECARSENAVLRMERGIGEFITKGVTIVSVSSANSSRELISEINRAYSVGRDRTVYQDAEYGIQQIVDIALKALSPGINDTTTAVSCIDFLGVILAPLASRQIETPYRSDGDQLRIITRGPTFKSFVSHALDPIRRSADGNVEVFVRMLYVIADVASGTTNAARRSVLLEQATLIMERAERTVAAGYDLDQVAGVSRHVAGVLVQELTAA